MFTKTFVRDASERVLATFAVSALGLWVAADAADLFTLETAKGAVTAGFIAAGTLVKVLVASRLGVKGSASLDPALGQPSVVARTPDGPYLGEPAE